MAETGREIPPGREPLMKLRAKPVRGLESGGEAAPDVSDARVRESMNRLGAALAKEVVENPRTPLGEDARALVEDHARHALEKLSAHGEAAELTFTEEIALEAVVHSDGTRPSLLIQDGAVVADDPRVGDWADELAMNRDALAHVIAATGRLIVNGDLRETSVFGTAWMIGPGLAATAQHVIEALFQPVGDEWVPKFGYKITLDFNVEAGRPAQPDKRIAVKRVLRPSPNRIDNRLDLGNLDAAILELETDGPPPLQLGSTLDDLGPTPQVHVVGHPFRPSAPDRPDVAPDAATVLTRQVLDLVFGDVFGVKRWSPGLIVTGPGSLSADVHRRVMTHDASTLGGNSGSPVIDLGDFPDRAVGLHYGGFFHKENYAHPCGAIRKQLEAPGVVFVP